MAKNLAFLVHKESGSMIYTYSKTDLSLILGVSLRTVIRNYSDVGRYESIHYIIYITDNKYVNDKETKYKRNVSPPVVKTYNSEQSHIMTDKVDTLSHGDRVIGHINTMPLFDEDDEPIEEDWRIVEKNLSISDCDKYYSKRTLEQLKESAKYFANKPHLMKYINKYGQLRELD